MPPKSPKAPTISKTSTYCGQSEDSFSSRLVRLNLILKGEPPTPGEWLFLAVYNGQIVLDGKWIQKAELETEALPLNLREPYYQDLVADVPLIFLLRIAGGKGAKDTDPLLNIDNRAGASVDLFPLIIGEEKVEIDVTLVDIITSGPTQCTVAVKALSSERFMDEFTTIPFTITMISAHCLPLSKDGTVYIAAIDLNGVVNPIAINFGMSLSTEDAASVVWATASSAGHAANTAISVPNEDKFISEDLSPKDSSECKSYYWNAMKRVRVDADLLRERLSSPLVLEVAGVPQTGKIDVRGRYMAFVDANVLLEPGQFGVTICTRLLFYNEFELPENVGALLELPPSSARPSARETDMVCDEFGHSSFIVIRFDLCEPLVQKSKISSLYKCIGLVPPEAPAGPIDDLDIDLPPEDPRIDVRKIRKESGALAVHKELSGFACRGAVPMNQGIRKTAANRLLMRVRSMLKQFTPGNCSYIDWQDIVIKQHASSRRAVTSSFAPQPPPIRPPARVAATRCLMAGDNRIANEHIEENIKFNARNPRALLCKALRCLDADKNLDAKKYILDGLASQAKCRYLLWLYGGQEFDKGLEAAEMASAAFRIAVKGNYSDGTSNAIGWAALHTLYHNRAKPYAAFVAAKKMRKAYELHKEWQIFLERWSEASGEEESFWIPAVIASDNPMLIAAAFFLCLRCYKFSSEILNCVEKGCGTRGSRLHLQFKPCPDLYYVRAASFVLRHKLDKAMDVTNEAIGKFGPTPIMSQMRTTILISARGWDAECNRALEESNKFGAQISPAVLLKAALGGVNTDPEGSLQRGAQAHKIAPCGHSALAIGRIYVKMKETRLAERWLTAAVKIEPLLADGWALLGMLAMYEKKLDKARTMLRTAGQVGPVSQDVWQEVKIVMEIVQLEALPESLVKDLCLCDYY